MTEIDIFAVVVDDELDARGLFCPEPVMMLHGKIRALQSGQRLRVIATDPSTRRDIPKFCTFLGHQLLLQEEVGEEFVYLIEKV
jgi:tRNA 2-thiouridine synthesizing protein A